MARFLRCCPGLAKGSIGEVLGEREPFYEEVREGFMQTFDFTGGLGGHKAGWTRGLAGGMDDGWLASWPVWV